MVAIRNSTHYSKAGHYSTMAIKNGMCGISFTNARPTNLHSPFLIDFATSITQRGKIELYERAEKATPPGLAIDEKGNKRTDTVKLLNLLKCFPLANWWCL